MLAVSTKIEDRWLNPDKLKHSLPRKRPNERDSDVLRASSEYAAFSIVSRVPKSNVEATLRISNAIVVNGSSCGRASVVWNAVLVFSQKYRWFALKKTLFLSREVFLD